MSNDSRARWALICAVALVSSLGMSRLQVGVDLHILIVPSLFTLAIILLGLMLKWLDRSRGSFVLTGGADFFGAAGQFFAFLTVAGGLQYVAAATALPLVDDALLRADLALGFDWSAFDTFLSHHSVLSAALAFAYTSIPLQLLALFCVHAMRPGSHANGEFIWLFVIALLIVTVVAIPFPALGHPGMIGQAHIDALIQARAGVVDRLDGIITFPSFHTALGVLFIYSARQVKPLLAIFVPLNVLLIAATPPCGGHYLVDTIAGLFVALLTISIVSQVRTRQVPVLVRLAA
jgi:PAP2 superfamily protein